MRSGGTVRRMVSVLAASVLFLLALPSCGIPPQHLNALYDAYSQSKWYYDSAPTLSANNAYVENGTDQQIVDVYAQKGDKPAPVLIFVHGGSWQFGEPKDYAALAKTFYNKGWVVFLPTYRKYPDVTYPAFADDTVAALNWSMAHIEEYGGDPKRVILAGHSSGAHLITYVLLDEQYRSKFDFDPMTLRGVVPLSGPFDFDAGAPNLRKMVHDVMGTPEGYHRAQPIFHIRADVPPMLLMVGEKDKLTPAAQVRDFAEKMKAAGAPVRYVELPGGDHYSIIIQMLEGHEGASLKHFMDFADEVFAENEATKARPCHGAGKAPCPVPCGSQPESATP